MFDKGIESGICPRTRLALSLDCGGRVDLIFDRRIHFFFCFSGQMVEDIPVIELADVDKEEEDPYAHLNVFEGDHSWIAREPLETKSSFTTEEVSSFDLLEERAEGVPASWRAIRPTINDRICTVYPGRRFPMYEFAFREAGYRLPFTDFQEGVFCHLALTPSQLHPNALAFIRAFELVCRYLEIGATVDLFFCIFQLQRSAAGREQSWVSFKQQNRLFWAYAESVRNFKDIFFVVKPLSLAAKRSLVTDETTVDESGHEITRVVSKFPLHWTDTHFR